MKVFIANFGRENYLWPKCLKRTAIATLEGQDVRPLRLAGDREAYIELTVATKTTAAGIRPTRPVAARWYNLSFIVETTEHDIWIHREKDELWWTTSRPGPPIVVLEPGHRAEQPAHEVYVLYKPAEPWSNRSAKGARLLWRALHPRAQEFLFTESTFQQLSSEHAAYALALLNGDDLSRWHSLPKWIEKAERYRRNPVTLLDARERAIAEMVLTARETVARADGREVLRTAKIKENRFRNLQEFEGYVRMLLKEQEDLCAVTGIRLQFPASGDDPDLFCSLDCIDSDGHYAPGNLQIVCRFVNRWKCAEADSNFRRLIALVRQTEDE